MTFTFDDGPSIWTPAILDLLAEYNQTAMFFITGRSLKGKGHIVRRAHDEGHTIGVHGWWHRRLTDLPDDIVRSELLETQVALKKITGERIRFFRAPYFATDDRVNLIAETLGLEHVGATLVPDDWCALDSVILAGKITVGLRGDSVVSLHDGVPPDGGSSSCTKDRLVTVEALRLVLESLVVAA